ARAATPAPPAATGPDAATPSAIGGRGPTSHDPSLTMSSQGATPAPRTAMSVSPAPGGRGSGSDSSRTSPPNRSIPAAFTKPPAYRRCYASLDKSSPSGGAPLSMQSGGLGSWSHARFRVNSTGCPCSREAVQQRPVDNVSYAL